MNRLGRMPILLTTEGAPSGASAAARYNADKAGFEVVVLTVCPASQAPLRVQTFLNPDLDAVFAALPSWITPTLRERQSLLDRMLFTSPARDLAASTSTGARGRPPTTPDMIQAS
jgi:hypothetical protein